jgi:hypothetical protein
VARTMRVGRANSSDLNSYCATTVLHTLPRLSAVAISGSSSCIGTFVARAFLLNRHQLSTSIARTGLRGIIESAP